MSETLLHQISAFLAERMGLRCTAERRAELLRGLAAAAREFGFANDLASCAQWLLSAAPTRHQIETLAAHLTVGETYFFRDAPLLQILETQILPQLIAKRRQSGERHLRIWSAGSCSGEEAYTLAILLQRLLPDLQQWRLTILATDINPQFLKKARRGVYSEWSFRAAPSWLQEEYFSEVAAKKFELHASVRAMVKFEYLNLVEDLYPSLTNDTNAMDIIFCRNVLMYFTPEQAQKSVSQLRASLVAGGWLATSASEHLFFADMSFETERFDGATFYRKANASETPSRAFYSQPARCETRTEYSGARETSISKPVASPILPPDRTVAEMIQAARQHADEGRLDEALNCCNQAIAADKVNAGQHYLRALILQEQNELDEAARALRRALFLDHDFVMAHYALGNLARQQGKKCEVQKQFNNVRALLANYKDDEILPHSEGVSAGRLHEIVETLKIV